MVYGSGSDPQPLLDNQFPYYVENIVNQGLCLKFNSKVRDWDAFVTAWAKARDEASLVREYCFDDPHWLGWAKDQMRDAVRSGGLADRVHSGRLDLAPAFLQLRNRA
jgi:hypothetical protein